MSHAHLIVTRYINVAGGWFYLFFLTQNNHNITIACEYTQGAYMSTVNMNKYNSTIYRYRLKLGRMFFMEMFLGSNQ